ncbi:hypothetical protein QYF36_007400 [Acer negundo]|nr:hypothetical protein QYF36_007400 [Acer negundo]
MRSVLVVVERFFKYTIFIAAPNVCPIEKEAELFFKNVVKHFGVPVDIVNDRDARFTGKFWTYLFNLMGSELKSSIANNPQTNDVAQFRYNLHKSSSTGLSPAKLCMRFQPLTPLEVTQQKDQGLCPAAYRFAREKTELIEGVIECLSKTARMMKKYADQNLCTLEFNIGDKVLLKLTPRIWKKVTN